MFTPPPPPYYGKFGLAALLTLAVLALAGAALAQSDGGTRVDIRVWESADDPARNFISARAEGGSWRDLGTLPVTMDGVSASGAYRYGDIALTVAHDAPLTPAEARELAGLRARNAELETQVERLRAENAELRARPTPTPVPAPTAAPSSAPEGGAGAPPAATTASPPASATGTPTATPAGSSGSPPASASPTSSPTASATSSPTAEATASPTASTTPVPTASPSVTPSDGGTPVPTPTATPAPATTSRTLGGIPCDTSGTTRYLPSHPCAPVPDQAAQEYDAAWGRYQACRATQEAAYTAALAVWRVAQDAHEAAWAAYHAAYQACYDDVRSRHIYQDELHRGSRECSATAAAAHLAGVRGKGHSTTPPSLDDYLSACTLP